jgi:hypothetical protein
MALNGLKARKNWASDNPNALYTMQRSDMRATGGQRARMAYGLSSLAIPASLVPDRNL